MTDHIKMWNMDLVKEDNQIDIHFGIGVQVHVDNKHNIITILQPKIPKKIKNGQLYCYKEAKEMMKICCGCVHNSVCGDDVTLECDGFESA